MSPNHMARRHRPARAGLAAGLTTLLALSGCGFVNTGDGDGDTATLTTYTSPEQNTGLADLYAAYEEREGVTVDASHAAAEELNQQLRVQLTSGTAPDVIRVSPGYSSPVSAGVLGEADELADLSDSAWAGQLDESTAVLAGDGERTVAYPVGRNAIVAAYNKEVFEELSLEVPTTWSELLAVCEELEAAGKTPIAAGLSGGVYLQFFVYALAGTLVHAEQPDLDERMRAGETSFADEAAWTEVFEKLTELNEYFTPDALGVPADQAQQALARGEAGMTLLVSAGLPQLFDYAAEGSDAFEVFALPADDDPDATVLPTAPDFLAVNAASPRVDEARTFLDFLAEPENVESYATTLGVLPGVGETAQAADSPLAPVLPLVDEGRTAPYANYLWPNGDTQQTLLQSGQQLLAGEIGVPALLDQLDEQYAKGTR
ncbi:ABC transporter substrate-binding protein [Streptomyces profundus]|uniref:ABC transporter substrate-binding protein n=1 Tax=Streptomyces profundus TaxID=2867410 RepID=UPI001D16225E|nr:ABC transporter substrate-binding protein [Streptomyces sp. MA3_2.13]UED83218.1 ABC transporter substrate-binding protein [Streptomyces sp. MA3_2.13]